MNQIAQLVLFVLAGALVALISGIRNIQDASWYMIVIGGLLAIGLYASTFGIVVAEAKKHTRIIVMAVTVGVFLKALIIGGSLALLFRDPYYLIVGVAVAQIDPLSVSVLMKGKRLSERAKAILGAWSSFDDPVTVLMALYVPVVVASLTHSNWGVTTDAMSAHAGFVGYLGELGFNILYVVVTLLLWVLLKRRVLRYFARGARAAATIAYVFLASVLAVAVYNFWMLGVALAGLYIRPPISRIIEEATKWALWLAMLLLGFLVVEGMDIFKGLLLGAVAYMSQIIVGILLTRGLPHRDRVHLALAQQNGITAIILSLLFEPVFPGTVAIVAPAIVVINILHHFVNAAIDKRLDFAST